MLNIILKTFRLTVGARNRQLDKHFQYLQLLLLLHCFVVFKCYLTQSFSLQCTKMTNFYYKPKLRGVWLYHYIPAELYSIFYFCFILMLSVMFTVIFLNLYITVATRPSSYRLHFSLVPFNYSESPLFCIQI